MSYVPLNSNSTYQEDFYTLQNLLDLCFQYLEYEVTSRFVDHKLVDEWLNYHFKDVPKTNANNTHILKHAADKWLEKQNDTTG